MTRGGGAAAAAKWRNQQRIGVSSKQYGGDGSEIKIKALSAL